MTRVALACALLALTVPAARAEPSAQCPGHCADAPEVACGEAAEVGAGEMDAAKRLRRLATSRPPLKARLRADHRMSPTHHVKTLDQRADFAMGSRQVTECNLGPVAPACSLQLATGLLCIRTADRIVPGERRWPVIHAALVGVDDVTQRWRLMDDVVPA